MNRLKNTINYYYNLNINTIHQKEKNYYFKADNKNYLLLKCTNIEEPDDIYRLNIYLSQILPVHRIVLNANNEAITKINDSNYLLLELFSNNNKINLNNIIELSNIRIPFSVDKLKRNDWYNLWIKKVDYFEYQLSQIGKKYPLIRESFNYYIGLAENAIILVNNIDFNNIPLGLSHRRITNMSFNLYNPLNIVIDVRIRDVCEYFKFCFFNNIDISMELELFLSYNSFNIDEAKLFLARMFFPTYYFDLYEKIIDNEIDESEIKKVIIKADNYEKILKQVYYHFKNNQINIEWLEI